MKEKLTDEEFIKMFQLLSRYMTTEMDQWDAWKFKAEYGEMFIHLDMKPLGDTHMYDDMTNLLNQKEK